jgi:hypothetical protein
MPVHRQAVIFISGGHTGGLGPRLGRGRGNERDFSRPRTEMHKDIKTLKRSRH